MARKKQLRIRGTEPVKIREVEVAAEAYVKARDERMEKTEAETAAKETLVAMMEKHHQSIYRDDDTDPPLLITLMPGKTGVKVTEIEEEEESFEDRPPRGRSAAAASAPQED